MSRDPWRAARWGLALRLALLVTLLVAGGGAGLYLYVRHALLGAFDAAHDLAIASILEDVDSSGPAPIVDRRRFAEEFDELKGLGVVAVTIWDPSGLELARASADGTTITMNGPRRAVTGGGDGATVVRREILGPKGGTIAVARRAGDVGHELDSLTRGLFLLVPAALAGSLIVGWIMAGQSLRRVHEAFERQRAFMADASHELRTPLAVIRTHAEVQLEGGDAATGERAFHVVARTAARMGTLVDELLFLSRSDGSSLTLERLPLSLDGLVEEVVESFEPMAKQRRCRLELTAAPEGIDLEADPTQLERLVGILLDNALRHGRDGRRVEVSVSRVGRDAVLTVEDDGPGIPAELLPRAFERFVRGPSAEAREGHGLGLAIARTIVTAHGGTITLGRSELGGAAARVKLPIGA